MDEKKLIQSSAPSPELWLREAKAAPEAEKCGMYLLHNGVVRRTPRAEVREGKRNLGSVEGMRFDYDPRGVEKAVDATRGMPGIYYVRVWLNRGSLRVGDDIMLVLIGGDIRPRVVDALQFLVGELKSHCVSEQELIPEIGED